MRWINELSKEQRAGLLLLNVYERVRREYQNGYRAWEIVNKEIVEERRFKVAVNVANWLTAKYPHWDLTHKEVRWTGYIKHAFRQLAPTIPHLAQLKNPVLLKNYFAGAPDWTPPERSALEMDQIYAKVLADDFKPARARAALGLRPRVDSDLK